MQIDSLHLPHPHPPHLQIFGSMGEQILSGTLQFGDIFGVLVSHIQYLVIVLQLQMASGPSLPRPSSKPHTPSCLSGPSYYLSTTPYPPLLGTCLSRFPC